MSPDYLRIATLEGEMREPDNTDEADTEFNAAIDRYQDALLTVANMPDEPRQARIAAAAVAAALEDLR
jgi:hypothetical protein